MSSNFPKSLLYLRNIYLDLASLEELFKIFAHRSAVSDHPCCLVLPVNLVTVRHCFGIQCANSSGESNVMRSDHPFVRSPSFGSHGMDDQWDPPRS